MGGVQSEGGSVGSGGGDLGDTPQQIPQTVGASGGSTGIR